MAEQFTLKEVRFVGKFAVVHVVCVIRLYSVHSNWRSS